MLKTETNTQKMERKVLRAAHDSLGNQRLSAFFEHGQWWVESKSTGAQWSVCDTNTPNGFCFEQVTKGEE
jgi:hypothetical protein